MGPLNKVIEMIPGMDKLFQPNEGEGEHHSADPARKVKKFMIIMDSMTDDGTRSHPAIPSSFHVLDRHQQPWLTNCLFCCVELDDPEVWKKEKDVQSRVHRIARGAGCAVTDVNALLANYRAITRLAPPRRGGGLRQVRNPPTRKMTPPHDTHPGQMTRARHTMRPTTRNAFREDGHRDRAWVRWRT
jgi:signal recognition particle GTPase